MPLKELEDYDWFPKTLRQFQMDVIGFMVKALHLYKPIVPVIEKLVVQHNIEEIVDLCSGSGLPSMYIQERLHTSTKFVLTDKYPQQIKLHAQMVYAKESINALTLVPHHKKLYSMYNAFHHFEDKDKVAFVEQFRKNKAILCIVEVITPNLQNIFQVIIASTIVQLIIAPFIKPFSLKRLALTYIVPINVITVLVDGIISVIKAKSAKQYNSLLQSLNTMDYVVEANTIFSFPNKIIVIKAQPIHATA